jgi:hypothetical protein
MWKRLLSFAQQMLAQHREFYPFSTTITTQGHIMSVAGDIGQEHPKSADIIGFLMSAMSKQAADAEIRSAGICLDVRTSPPGQSEKVDAIQGHGVGCRRGCGCFRSVSQGVRGRHFLWKPFRFEKSESDFSSGLLRADKSAHSKCHH